LRNDFQLGLFNGDRGIILKFRGQPFGVFKEAKGYRAIPLSYLTQWECCFAQTVHKSQGSEYKRVLFVLPPGAQNMMYRELLYTGVTRASDELKIYAFEESLKSCLSRPVRRFSGLSEFFLTSDY
ncbi:MAG: ATP-binding domain-containing protein, partial [Spirochaetaceae bacterium]|nr:ATP-binding domain-containing protein [Spirochaetaceae bacterium]